MSALAAAHGLRLDGRTLALLCQKVENHCVGAPPPPPPPHLAVLFLSGSVDPAASWHGSVAGDATPTPADLPLAPLPAHLPRRRALRHHGPNDGRAGRGGAPAGAQVPAGGGAGLRGGAAAPAVLGPGLGWVGG